MRISTHYSHSYILTNCIYSCFFFVIFYGKRKERKIEVSVCSYLALDTRAPHWFEYRQWCFIFIYSLPFSFFFSSFFVTVLKHMHITLCICTVRKLMNFYSIFRSFVVQCIHSYAFHLRLTHFASILRFIYIRVTSMPLCL